MTTSIKVDGVPVVLRYLRQYEPELYKQLRSQVKEVGSGVARVVAQEFSLDPLRNWHSTPDRRGEVRLPGYSAARAVAAVRPVVPMARPRGMGSVPVLRIAQNDAGGAVYESAGSNSTSRFVQNLDKRLVTKSTLGKTRSRVLFAATKQQYPMIEHGMERVVEVTDRYITQAILAG